MNSLRAYLRPACPLLLACAALAACGDGEVCGGDHTGTWQGITIADQIELGADCSFVYQGLNCSSQGTYASPLGPSGQVRVEIDAATGSNCLSPGTYSCEYTVNERRLTFNCGAGVFTYER